MHCVSMKLHHSTSAIQRNTKIPLYKDSHFTILDDGKRSTVSIERNRAVNMAAYLVLFAVNLKHRYGPFSVNLIPRRMLPHTLGLGTTKPNYYSGHPCDQLKQQMRRRTKVLCGYNQDFGGRAVPQSPRFPARGLLVCVCVCGCVWVRG